jgi:hypothetical protein
MKLLASVIACAACLLAMPAFAGSASTSDSPIVLTGAHVCVGPACVGTDRDDDWRWRHRHHDGYASDRGCRDVTIRDRRPDGDVVVRHERRCD